MESEFENIKIDVKTKQMLCEYVSLLTLQRNLKIDLAKLIAKSSDVDRQIDDIEKKMILKNLPSNLTLTEKMVYYFNNTLGITLYEISQILYISESRIKHIKSDANKKIKCFYKKKSK